MLPRGVLSLRDGVRVGRLSLTCGVRVALVEEVTSWADSAFVQRPAEWGEMVVRDLVLWPEGALAHCWVRAWEKLSLSTSLLALTSLLDAELPVFPVLELEVESCLASESADVGRAVSHGFSRWKSVNALIRSSNDPMLSCSRREPVCWNEPASFGKVVLWGEVLVSSGRARCRCDFGRAYCEVIDSYNPDNLALGS
jgi:hypothetical protein